MEEVRDQETVSQLEIDGFDRGLLGERESCPYSSHVLSSSYELDDADVDGLTFLHWILEESRLGEVLGALTSSSRSRLEDVHESWRVDETLKLLEVWETSAGLVDHSETSLSCCCFDGGEKVRVDVLLERGRSDCLTTSLSELSEDDDRRFGDPWRGRRVEELEDAVGVGEGRVVPL